jgi:hypothetical protein
MEAAHYNRIAVLWFFITTVRWSCFRKGGGSDKNKIETDYRVNDEKLSPCLPFFVAPVI